MFQFYIKQGKITVPYTLLLVDFVSNKRQKDSESNGSTHSKYNVLLTLSAYNFNLSVLIKIFHTYLHICTQKRRTVKPQIPEESIQYNLHRTC